MVKTMKDRYVALYDSYDRTSSYTLKSGRRAKAKDISLQELSETVKRRRKAMLKRVNVLLVEIKETEGYRKKTLLLHLRIGREIARYKDFLSEHDIRDVRLVERFMKECKITKTKSYQMERFYRIFEKDKELVIEMDGRISWTFIRKQVIKKEEGEITKTIIVEEYKRKKEKEGVK